MDVANAGEAGPLVQGDETIKIGVMTGDAQGRLLDEVQENVTLIGREMIGEIRIEIEIGELSDGRDSTSQMDVNRVTIPNEMHR